MISKLILFLFTVHSVNLAVPPDGKEVERLGQLFATSLIYRHGDRNPVAMYPGDPYNLAYWPEGWGQLTNLGKQQQFNLGRWSRARYLNLLGNTFRANEIYVRSSDVDRTIMSAMANLAGLYPPTGNQIWNNNLPWQPIPVHVVTSESDYITNGGVVSCPAYDKAYNEYLQSDVVKKMELLAQPYYDYLTAALGTPIKDFLNVLMIRDSLYIQNIYNLSLPAWSKSIFPGNKKFDDTALTYYYLSSGTQFLSKFRSGFLLKDILDRYKSKAATGFTSDLKYYAYSTHDSVVSNFLNALGVFDYKFVPYAAAIIMEMRYYQNEFYVILYYKNSDANPEPINIPNCGTACPLSRWYQLYDGILPKNDYKTECLIK
ncbi:hypothetical protein HA402_001059 [Bradysia odoriphaga]|nr:hypothetical protein HA402_001059 [Bradysia odoriphaga]